MYDDIVKRLESFGYTVDPEVDNWVLTFLIEKVTNHILNFCNLTSVPEELYHVAVDMVVGEFLKSKKAAGQLDESEILGSEAVKQIKLGDTTVSYAEGKSASVQLDSLIAFLTKGYEADLVSFRRLRW